MRPAWDILKSWEWNYSNGPLFEWTEEAKALREEVKDELREEFLGFKLNSTIGTAAGPILNSNWIKLYSELGFDILTQKTVRSRPVPAYKEPNIVFVHPKKQLENNDFGATLTGDFNPEPVENISITNSFGMGSFGPEVWMKDVKKAKSFLKKGQLLNVSVVGTVGKDASLEELADDYAETALMAKKAGADLIETNFSCPNVETKDSLICFDPKASSFVAEKVRDKIGETKYLIKLGYYDNDKIVRSLIKETAHLVDGYVAINTIKMRVANAEGKEIMPGRFDSGICGSAIKKKGLETAERFVRIRKELKEDFAFVGVGGIMSPNDAKDYYDLGVNAIQTGTIPIFDPLFALKAKKFLYGD